MGHAGRRGQLTDRLAIDTESALRPDFEGVGDKEKLKGTGQIGNEPEVQKSTVKRTTRAIMDAAPRRRSVLALSDSIISSAVIFS